MVTRAMGRVFVSFFSKEGFAMRFSQHHIPLLLPITAAESVAALLAANQQAFADKFDEQASWLVEQDSLLGRADASATALRQKSAVSFGRP